MCGLVGLISKSLNGFSKEQQDVFSTLLLVDFVRGPDSTGLFMITNRGDVHVRKEAADPISFMRTDEYEDMMKKSFSRGAAIIGHNRKATRGEVNDDNAHPFIVDDNIILVHNGTLYGDHKKLADVEVDSHAIAHTIHEKGDVQEAMKEIDGAYALIWYDFKEQKLNFLRNSSRPLWTCETPSAYIWASEKEMLDFVIGRHKLTCLKSPFELPVDALQTFTLKQGGGWEPDVKKLDIKRPVSSTSAFEDIPEDWHDIINREMGPVRGRRQQQHPILDLRGLPGVDYNTETTVEDEIRKTENKMRINSEPIVKGTTTYFEMNLAKEQNKIVTHAEYHREVIPVYPWGVKVTCLAFDYTLANQRDDTGGFYLYGYVVDDPDVIVRQWFDRKYMDENRIIQIAGTDYIYEFTIGQKRWIPFQPGEISSLTPGCVIMHSEGARLLHGGGIGDPKVLEKLRTMRH